MDPGLLTMITEMMKGGIALYLATLRLSGKTEEEINAQFTVELAKAMAFDPQKDIMDV
jgi:hypothetical protein